MFSKEHRHTSFEHCKGLSFMTYRVIRKYYFLFDNYLPHVSSKTTAVFLSEAKIYFCSLKIHNYLQLVSIYDTSLFYLTTNIPTAQIKINSGIYSQNISAQQAKYIQLSKMREESEQKNKTPQNNFIPMYFLLGKAT